VLVTDDINGQTRGALATVRAVAGSRYRPVVSVAGRSLAASSRHCAGTVLLPTGGTAGYPAALRAELATGRYHAFLPASDVAMIAVDDPAAQLVDKACLDARARSAGFASLPTSSYGSVTELRAVAADLDYPVVVKSATKSGRGNLQARVLLGPRDVDALGDAPGRLVVQPFLDGPITAVSGVIEGGQLLAVCHQLYLRIWPPRAGVSSAAVTVAGDRAVEDRLLPLLAGHRGVFQVQFLGGHLLDVNPRVYGSMALAVAAGANLPLVACEALAGRSPRSTVRARSGVHYRWLEGDLRYLVARATAGRAGLADAARVLRPRRRTVHSVESLIDPRPMVSRLTDVLRRHRATP
jgi:hypothetical protein